MKNAKKIFLNFTIGFILSACGGGGQTTGSLSGTLIFAGDNPGSATNIPTITNQHIRIDTNAHNNLNTNNQEEFVPGEVLIKFKNGIRAQAISTLSVGNKNLLQVRPLASKQSYKYRANNLNAKDTKTLIAELNKRNDIAEAIPNRIYHADKTPNDSAYVAQWHYPMFNLPNAWDIEDGVSPIVNVAVVDTGIIAHPDLAGVTLPGYDFISDETVANDGDGRDNDPTDAGDSNSSGYHGSHVAGTIAAKTNNSSGVAGVSWGAKIIPVRVLGVGGGTTEDILDGVQWAAGIAVAGVPQNPNPAKIINMSLGGKGPCSQIENDVYAQVITKGTIIAVAAGNSNEEAADHSPNNCNNMIRVGAVGPQKTRAPYSNYGLVDVMAPGGDTSQKFDFNGKSYSAGVLSTIQTDAGEYIYGFYQGTSMATPHIAGLLALMAAKEPSINYATALAKLKASAAPMTAAQCNRPSGTNDCGAGFVDAAKALNSNATPTPTPTPPPPPPPTPPAPPPPTTSDANTYVVAFYCGDPIDCLPYDENRSGLVKMTGGGIKIPFKVSDLVPGPYTIAAWQDLNGDQNVDNGEPIGASLTSTGRLKIVNLLGGQNLAGYSINMVPITGQSVTTTNLDKIKLQMQQLLNNRIFSNSANNFQK